MLFPSRPEAQAGWRGWLTPQPCASLHTRLPVFADACVCTKHLVTVRPEPR